LVTQTSDSSLLATGRRHLLLLSSDSHPASGASGALGARRLRQPWAGGPLRLPADLL